MARGVAWSRDHYLIALNLYCKLPFGRLHRRNPVIVDVADKLGRTPSSLAMKLCNLAALDPVQRARGVKGLSRSSATDQSMWDEFQANRQELAPASEQLLHDLFTSDDEQDVDLQQGRRGVRLVPPRGPTERTATVKARRGQKFFRESVINAYGARCCVSGIDVPELLIASHIRPWSEFPEWRLDPSNGLCLSRLHDTAFDDGLITFDEDLRLVLSARLERSLSNRPLRESFGRFEGRRLTLPEKLAEPDPECLAYHREFRFERADGRHRAG